MASNVSLLAFGTAALGGAALSLGLGDQPKADTFRASTSALGFGEARPVTTVDPGGTTPLIYDDVDPNESTNTCVYHVGQVLSLGLIDGTPNPALEQFFAGFLLNDFALEVNPDTGEGHISSSFFVNPATEESSLIFFDTGFGTGADFGLTNIRGLTYWGTAAVGSGFVPIGNIGPYTVINITVPLDIDGASEAIFFEVADEDGNVYRIDFDISDSGGEACESSF